MQGWSATAADTGRPGEAYAPWSIERSADHASDGQQALKLQMVNHTDAAKIWIVRPFAAQAGQQYDLDVSFAFATADFGSTNLFALLTGAFPTPPHDGPSLLAGTTHDATGNGADSDVGYQWLRKAIHTSARANSNGQLFVVVGIWGTWEGPRTYYLDDLSVELTPR